MKTYFIFFFLLLATLVQAQELIVHELDAPNAIHYSDLEVLRPLLEDKKVVMLGEHTHMYGNIFEMKARVVEFLHKELGFTTIAMESPVYDIWKMNKNGFSKKEFNDAIFGVWSGSIEFQRLVNYIEDNNLKVIGVDSQIIHTLNFIDDFLDYCEAQNITIKSDEDDLGIAIEGVLENYSFYDEDIKYSAYEKELKSILSQIEKLEFNEDNYYWKQIIEGVLASSKDAYYNKKEILTADFGNKNFNYRDEQMAENLLSYMQRSPEEKLIFWADNIHTLNDISSVKRPIIRDFISAGTTIKKTLKDKVYSLATTHANDSLFENSEWHQTPIQTNSFEYELKQLNLPYLFISSNQPTMQIPRETRLLHITDFTKARVDQLYDGYIFLNHATIPRTEIIVISKKEENIVKIIEDKITTQENETLIYKGKILNKDTKKPIAFTNLIIKDKEIYRVADGNGNYDITLKKTIEPDSKVTISSMGFETIQISISELTENIYLEQKTETLSEVVIKGSISPKTVLKEAIANLKINHPITPFNYYSYLKNLDVVNDIINIDVELITKDYDQGYLSPYRSTQRVEQIKWNNNRNQKKYRYANQFEPHRYNPIRFSNILNKRKYKKFKLDFIAPTLLEEEDYYIIAFEIDRDKWNYTNRYYPTKYSGRMYIDRDSYAVVKVHEIWEASFDSREINKYFNLVNTYSENNIIYEGLIKAKGLIIKEENVAYYSDKLGDNRYYPMRFYNNFYIDTIDKEGNNNYNLYERDFNIFDYETKDVEEIEYEFHAYKKNETLLNRVNYDPDFWEEFYKQLY